MLSLASDRQREKKSSGILEMLGTSNANAMQYPSLLRSNRPDNWQQKQNHYPQTPQLPHDLV